ncbi:MULTISPECIES: hypothetical protein [Halorussus]|uniref:hypothetical protein n=1 Tax=Halorussus TaxID=1070314 RepID=UPI000E2137EF|nr:MULTISPECIES: hypothetical protein [Halorussus]NHN58842.1 hypothetical protein [Halorussus sp. JP-T4]
MSATVGVSDSASGGRALGPRLSAVARAGTLGFGVALVLVTAGLLTAARPVGYLEWIRLPATLPVDQPRLGHYPASTTVGLWLWEVTFPLAVLGLYDRTAGGPVLRRRLLVGLPAAYMLGFAAYCRFVYLPRVQPTPVEPAVTAVCYAFCTTGVGLFGAATIAVGFLGVLSWLGLRRSSGRGSALATLAFGVLSLPLGAPAVYAGYRALRN